MMQFIDFETIKALIILFLGTGLMVSSLKLNKQKKEKYRKLKKKSNAKYYWLVYIIFLISVPFLEANNARMDAEKNIKSFLGAKVLRCIIKENQYRVSQKDNWQVEKYFFIKDSHMIRTDKCEVISYK